MTPKILIIRFSSFGDIIQSLSCAPELARQGEVHFLTKKSFGALPSLCPDISKVHEFDPKQGLLGLIKLGLKLRKDNYQLVYDAHENPRSKIVRLILSLFKDCAVIIRPKFRFRRFLFFRLKKRDALPYPFRGMVSFCKPVGVKPSQQKWNFEKLISATRRAELDSYAGSITLVPSAAWEMKRWPKEHWENVVQRLGQHSVILGGPEDLFCQEIAKHSELSTNLAGKLSLIESCYLVSISKVVVSADTGLLHVADLLNVPVLALLGPTAFGFPTFSNSKVMSVDMPCRPCSKDGSGGCTQQVWRQCMVDIAPERVLSTINQY